MLRALKAVFDDRSDNIRGKIIASYAFLIALNIGAWASALLMFRHNTVLLGFSALAYAFGLRHAVDADHIAAIDSVTRKLMQDKQRPAMVGFFFSMGHSMVLVIATAAIALTAMTIDHRFTMLNSAAGIIGTLISAVFLFSMAAMNLVIARSVYATFRTARRTGRYADDDFDILLNKRGFMSRLLRPLFRLVTRSWQMLLVGLLFGLGFDTATEVSLLGMGGAEAVKGVSVWAIMMLPMLFAAGMSLVDTTDGILMLGAYGWAFVKPIRKLYYNLTITVVSVIVAVIVGSVETLGLIANEFSLHGLFWRTIGAANDRYFGMIGFLIIGIFVASWLVSTLVYRLKRLDEVEIALVD
ncbi:MAG: HoxN/HupN/NixA family nickel/cobalt transporter [Proteobacteria bacterium]|nr:HoxN/HupN/NixA family nickel/cobalt transporter [Pseudomonadota bacterium]